MALRYNPNLGDAHHQLANCYMVLGRLGGALISARRAVALAPGNLGFLADLGQILLANDRVEEAAHCVHNVLTRNPSDQVALKTLTRITRLRLTATESSA
jgi:Flp pilus assembly protein TadD